MKSRDNKALKWDDLLADNFALQNQKDEVSETLAAIERDKQQLMTAIYNKSLERVAAGLIKGYQMFPNS